jgi:hypothetical protein
MESTERSFTEDNPVSSSSASNNNKKTSPNNDKDSGFECNVSDYYFSSIKS